MELNWHNPILRIFNGRTGKYELFYDEMNIDPYGNIVGYNYCTIEWFTGLFDRKKNPLFENDIIIPINSNLRQYRRIWKTLGGFVLSGLNDIKGLSKLDKFNVDFLTSTSVQQYIADNCEKVGSAITHPHLLKGRTREEMINDFIKNS